MITENLLVETLKNKEIIDLNICAPLYGLCNDKLFNHLSCSDFVCFFNLKYYGEPVKIKHRKKQHVLYLIAIIEEFIKRNQPSYADVWVDCFLDQLQLKKEDYKKYRYNIDHCLGSASNKAFVDAINGIFGLSEFEAKRRQDKGNDI